MHPVCHTAHPLPLANGNKSVCSYSLRRLHVAAGRDGGSTDKQKGSPPGGGNHRLLLLNSPKHKEPIVVKSLTQVVPSCDEDHARNCYATSQQLGMAIVTSCLKEHAEFYMQQLYRYGVKTAIEPDTTTA
jgi:ATP-dependent Clp protease adaptor protein ClpS